MVLPATVEEYLTRLPGGTREVVDEIRRIAVEVLPDPTESISYGMPTFSVAGRRVVHIGGWAQHVSLYPVPSAVELQAELAPYLAGRGTLKFPLSGPIPYDLIGRVIGSLESDPK
jgi:uncharacterized protein YdhG (YjbR/CyaY superfamily)